MLIDCPSCTRSYPVSHQEIGEGRNVVCPRCHTRWFVDGDGTSMTLPVAANDLRTTSFSARAGSKPIDDRQPTSSGRRGAWGWVRPAFTGTACLLLAMGLLGARERIVRLAPRSAEIYALIGLPVNVRGLEIAALASDRPIAASDVTISGEIRNVAHKRLAVPRLSYQVRDAAGAPLMAWTESLPSKMIPSGKSLPFVSSPRQMPANGRSILVRFEDDRDQPARVARQMY